MAMFFIVLSVINFLMNLVCYKALKNISNTSSFSHKKTHEYINDLFEDASDLENKADCIINKLNELSLDLQTPQEPIKPIKPNNWESFRKAFKGPMRVDINEHQ